MGRKRNKLRNAFDVIGLLSFFRHEHRIAKIAYIGSRTRSEDEFLHAKVQSIFAPPLSASAPCSGDGSERNQATKFGLPMTFG